MSLLAPSETVSMPFPGVIRSLPDPALMVSAFGEAVSVSSPFPPLMMAGPAPMVTVRSPFRFSARIVVRLSSRGSMNRRSASPVILIVFSSVLPDCTNRVSLLFGGVDSMLRYPMLFAARVLMVSELSASDNCKSMSLPAFVDASSSNSTTRLPSVFVSERDTMLESGPTKRGFGFVLFIAFRISTPEKFVASIVVGAVPKSVMLMVSTLDRVAWTVVSS